MHFILQDCRKKTCTMKKSDTLNTLNTMFYIAISGKCFHLLCHEQNYLFYLTFHWLWLHSFYAKFHQNTIHYWWSLVNWALHWQRLQCLNNCKWKQLFMTYPVALRSHLDSSGRVQPFHINLYPLKKRL